MINRRVLFVDDDPTLLDTYRRRLIGTFKVQTAEGPQAGLAAVQNDGPFAAIVSDLRMPGMGGVEFLARVATMAPETPRVMLTGFADTEAAVAAVNEGRIFRFLNKPCSHEQMVGTLEGCIEQYRLVTAERELLENTLAGSIRVLTDILGLTHPGVMSRASRLRRIMRHLARTLELSHVWQYELSGMLSQIGCLTIQPEILDKIWAGQDLAPEEDEIYRSHPAVGAQLLSHIPRLGTVAQIVARQQGTPAPASGEAAADEHLVLGGKMLQVAVELDRLTARGVARETAPAEMRRNPKEFPARLLDPPASLPGEKMAQVQRAVRVSELAESMVFDEDVRARNGLLLVARGHEVNVPVLLRLRSFARGIGVVEPIRVLVMEEDRGVARAA